MATVRSLTNNHVFIDKGRPLQRISRSVWTALKDAGIMHFRFQDLRPGASANRRWAGADTVSAMKSVGHTSETMWTWDHSIQEKDLTQAAQKVHNYLQENMPGILADVIGEE